jgi:hypothetical protein
MKGWHMFNLVQTCDFSSAQNNSAAKLDYYESGPITDVDQLANDLGSTTLMGLYDASTNIMKLMMMLCVVRENANLSVKA